MEQEYQATTPSDYEHLRDRMDAASIRWCAAGGQAVNVWALHYATLVPAIRRLGPFTSKDIDPLIISLVNTESCPELKISSWLNPSAISGVVSAPDTGSIGEILKFLPGIPDSQWINRLEPRTEGWPVVPPDALYASKCWNLLNIPQSGRYDARHLDILNHVLRAHLAQADANERAAILQTFQQLADNGTLSRVLQMEGPEIATAITPHVTLPEHPFPSFHVASGLYDQIRLMHPDEPHVHALSRREEDWATLVVQFHDEEKAQQIFIERYGSAFESYLTTLQKGKGPCLT